MAETTKIKFIRGVHYKGVEFKAGATASVEPHVAERIIADGNAEVAESEPRAVATGSSAKSKESKTSEK